MCKITQGFYENAANAYASIGMKGHGGIDEHCGYGTDIKCPLDGFVSNVLDSKHPASDGYWGIYIICNYKGQIGELCVGHCSKINVKMGDKVYKGQVIGQEGNHGYVFEDGVKITLEMQAKGDKRGTHRHWQWRHLFKREKYDDRMTFITSWGIGAYRDPEGFYYVVEEPNNGFKGLSPVIGEILNDFIGFPTVVDTQKSLIKILSEYVRILKDFIKLK